MIPLVLPATERRSFIQSFWLLCSCIAGAALWLAGWQLGVPYSPIIGLVGALGCEFFLWLNPRLVARFYRGWNRFIVLPFAKLAGRASMGICFFIVFVGTGSTGSRLRSRIHGLTTWEERGSPPAQANAPGFSLGHGSVGTTGWLRGYLAWAVRSGNLWSVTLLPFLLFLRMLGPIEPERAQGNIYTLF